MSAGVMKLLGSVVPKNMAANMPFLQRRVGYRGRIVPRQATHQERHVEVRFVRIQG